MDLLHGNSVVVLLSLAFDLIEYMVGMPLYVGLEFGIVVTTLVFEMIQ